MIIGLGVYAVGRLRWKEDGGACVPLISRCCGGAWLSSVSCGFWKRIEVSQVSGGRGGKEYQCLYPASAGSESLAAELARLSGWWMAVVVVVAAKPAWLSLSGCRCRCRYFRRPRRRRKRIGRS